MKTPDESEPTRPTPSAPRSANDGTSPEPDEQGAPPGEAPDIRTPEEAIQGLRALSREALTLREGLGRLLEGELSGAPSARRHLRLGQAALDHAAAVFELLATLLESD